MKRTVSAPAVPGGGPDTGGGPGSGGGPGGGGAGTGGAAAPVGRPGPSLRERLAAWSDADGGSLFDPPGPRGRARIAVATVVSLLVAAALVWLAVRQFARHGQLDAAKWNLFTQQAVIRYLLTGLWATVRVTLVSAAIALPCGALLALGRLARNRPVKWLAGLYVETMRAVPLLLLIYAFLFGLPSAGVRLPLFWQLVWPIVITNAAVFAEIFRAGVRSLPRGQTEAAYALGLRYWPTMRLVVLPQAIRATAPSLIGQLVRLLKDSTLGYVVSFLELLNSAKVLGEYDHTIVQSYLVVAAVYVVVNSVLAGAAGLLERRLGPARRRRRHRPATVRRTAAPA
ncbi:putative glutamate ABC transporter permease [Actinacidiphila reveromycinica]|uniref:Putative glutamate ABC transporter permease n=1 Tax=Actinacidiphila reveromycinica TaxID=659352 RepID=A0A7U3VQY6_9ACTN|nr:amino acid ABC transporter permease [Streptomyces sp. SN-593]BBB00318.1 putative glutamate ABC transporter permease [Streptomyces sp. SN-593]